MTESIIDKEMVSLLKLDNKGWNVRLFKDQNKISTVLCFHCNGVCCNAVELGCNHNDVDIELFCEECLKDLIKKHHNKCPINSHNEPIISSNRAIRKIVLNSNVFCINNIKYNDKQKNDENGGIVDTVCNDEEKEGVIVPVNNNDNDNNVNGCKWSGKLSKLLSSHLSECINKNNKSFIQNIKINKLEKENKKLNDDNNTTKVNLNDLKNKLNKKDEEINKLKKENEILKNQNIVKNVSNKINVNWKKNKYGKNLIFENDETIKMTEYNGYGSLCLINKKITNKMCNKFNIKFKCNGHKFVYQIGYTLSFDFIKDWDKGLGFNHTPNNSVSLFCNYKYDHFFLCDKNNEYKQLSYKPLSSFKSGDTFLLEFDFNGDYLQIYHNDNKADKISLNGNKTIIPGVAFESKDTSMSIMEYNFY